jgi:hypothetical protein
MPETYNVKYACHNCGCTMIATIPKGHPSPDEAQCENCGTSGARPVWKLQREGVAQTITKPLGPAPPDPRYVPPTARPLPRPPEVTCGDTAAGEAMIERSPQHIQQAPTPPDQPPVLYAQGDL